MVEGKKTRVKQWVVALGVILVAVVISAGLLVFRPKAEKTKAVTRPTLVETITARKTNEPVHIVAFGTVQANRQLTVQAELGGRVIELSQDLDAGGLVKEGDILLKIDPRNYVTAVEQEKASVQKAEFELKVEEGKRLIAKREWELLDRSIQTSEIGKELALREPHIKEKTASLAAAKSKLERALLDLKKTVLVAPFDAMVTEEFVEVGQLISPQTKVATLISTDEFRIQVSIPYDQLSWIELPSEGNQGSPVIITQDLGDGKVINRKGEVLRLLGTLDPNGRMARLLVVVKDPMGLNEKEFSTIPLLIGTYVQVDIQGPILHDVIVIPRAALREGERVWVMDQNNTLEIRKVKIVSRTKDSVIVTEGLASGDKVIVSALPAALPGMELRTISTISYQ